MERARAFRWSGSVVGVAREAWVSQRVRVVVRDVQGLFREMCCCVLLGRARTTDCRRACAGRCGSRA